MKRKVTFELTLFDDKSVLEKLEVLNSMECMFDDERNQVPQEYWDLVNVPPGGKIRITVERLDNLPNREQS